MHKFDTYMNDDFYDRLKKVSEKVKISMSSLLKSSFVLKYEKIYPEIFKLKKVKE